ncbi:MAG: Sec-independent protein translocase protein TatB [Gammaproteobacteria bacterium]
MFDIGFWEIAVIGVVALLVVGPDRLPGLARDAGRWSGSIRRFVSNTKREIERELQFDPGKDLSSRITELDDLMQYAPDKQQTSEKDSQKPG